MAKYFLLVFLCIAVIVSAQSWQSKNTIRVESAGASLKLVFSDSTYSYILRRNISYIVSVTGSQYVTIGFLYPGSTSKIIQFPYTQITQPSSTSAADLSRKLNIML